MPTLRPFPGEVVLRISPTKANRPPRKGGRRGRLAAAALPLNLSSSTPATATATGGGGDASGGDSALGLRLEAPPKGASSRAAPAHSSAQPRVRRRKLRRPDPWSSPRGAAPARNSTPPTRNFMARINPRGVSSKFARPIFTGDFHMSRNETMFHEVARARPGGTLHVNVNAHKSMSSLDEAVSRARSLSPTFELPARRRYMRPRPSSLSRLPELQPTPRLARKLALLEAGELEALEGLR